MKQEKDVSIVKVQETQLDADVAPEFKEQIERLMMEGRDQVILDMSDLKSMDNNCLGALVGVLAFVGSRSKMIVIGLKGSVKELFQKTHMDHVFELAENETIARQKLTF